MVSQNTLELIRNLLSQRIFHFLVHLSSRLLDSPDSRLRPSLHPDVPHLASPLGLNDVRLGMRPEQRTDPYIYIHGVPGPFFFLSRIPISGGGAADGPGSLPPSQPPTWDSPALGAAGPSGARGGGCPGIETGSPALELWFCPLLSGGTPSESADLSEARFLPSEHESFELNYN